MNRSLILVFLCAVLGIVSQQARGAPFTNGSFENFGAWDVTHGPGGASDLQFYGEGSTDGFVCAVFNASFTVGAGVLSQTFDTVPGHTYPVSLDFGNYGLADGYPQQLLVQVRDGGSIFSGTDLIDSGSANFIAGANLGASISQSGSLVTLIDTTGTDNASFYLPVPESLQFSTAEFTFTALSTTSTLMFTDQTGNSGSWTDANIDNVQVNGVPEPGTLALVVAGLVTLACARPRRSLMAKGQLALV